MPGTEHQPAVEFRILGPVSVLIDGRRCELGGPRQDRLLALLVLRDGETVTGEAVVDALWGDDPPDTARRQVHNAIAALRRGLGPARARLVTESAGYRIELENCLVDAREFDHGFTEARELHAAADLDGAAARLTAALDLWRGPALEGLEGHVFTTAAARLDEHRLLARQLLLDCRLDLGEAAAVVPELYELVAEHPLREALHTRLLLALYRSGRQADALTAYQRARQTFDEELGVEPGEALRELHQQILRAEVPPTPSAPESEVASGPSTLPYAVTDFTGRDDEVTELTKHSGTRGPGVSITVLAGMAGVGKTTLAVRAAHSVAVHYPGGRIFLDLQGHTPGARPLDPDTALEILLRTTGTPSDQIPEPGPLRVSRWRSQVADRRLLLVFDNVRDAAQIRPLIPSGRGSWVMATSRSKLSALEGATRLELDVLPAPEAEALFRRVAGEEHRTADAELVAAVTELCGRLPLALRIAAARLRDASRDELAGLVERLRAHRQRLAELAVDDVSVQAAFAVSYDDLAPAGRRAFALLGLHPGPDLGVHAAAALFDLTVAETEPVLERLVNSSLLARGEHRRYRLHDLLRDYAGQLAERLDPAERTAAGERLGHFYLALGRAGEALLDPGLELVEPGLDQVPELPRLATAEDVRRVIDDEHRAFLPVLTAAGTGSRAVVLAVTLGTCLLRHGHAAAAAEAFETGLSAAESRGDAEEQATLLRHLGVVSMALGRFGEAVAELERGLALTTDPLTEGRLHGNLGIVHMRQGDDPGAERHLRRAHALLHRDGTARDQAAILGNLGLVLTRRERYAEAAEHHRRALAVNAGLGNVRLETSSLVNVGWNALLGGDADGAREPLTRALKLSREMGAKGDEARSLSMLAECFLRTGEADAAFDQADTALLLAREIANPDVEARALEVLGRVHERRGDRGQAEHCYRELLAVATASGQDFRVALAHEGLTRLRG
ncbi:tetratricopeptide repeat protein [Saccharothrix sp. AJ9571]|nr:tetratricopeptide repeat protein [Saccharothrix sp. AJ9571]